MPVPSSGELKLWDMLWNQELAGSKGDNSLHSASVYAGFSTPDALSDFYGYSDVEAPSVTTQALSSIGNTSMQGNGTVTDTGNENPSRGFYFGTSTNRTSNTKYTIGTGGAGAFQRTFTGLSQLTTFYCWAFAENSAGEANGSMVQASTTEQSYTATFSQMTEGYASSQANINRDDFDNSQFGYNHSWVNPYSSNLNQIQSGTSGIGSEQLNANTGTIANNATTKWTWFSQRNREFRFDTGGPINSPHAFWLIGPSGQGQMGQFQMTSTRHPGHVVTSGGSGAHANAGNGNQSNQAQVAFSWTFNLANPRSNGPHSRQITS
tara:strand:+ start:1510 stop:2472 length:963 start_codon:yes stop_codon:yes gene_type:complete